MDGTDGLESALRRRSIQHLLDACKSSEKLDSLRRSFSIHEFFSVQQHFDIGQWSIGIDWAPQERADLWKYLISHKMLGNDLIDAGIHSSKYVPIWNTI